MRLNGAGGLKRGRSDSGLRIPPLTRSRVSLARWAPREAATWLARDRRSTQLQSLRATLKQAQDVYWAEQVEIQRLAAEAWTAHAAGQTNEALKLMRAAADLEDASEKHVAMENRLWPMRELLGELLLALKQPAEALRAFELSFKAAPNRFRGFYGAARAAEQLGNRAQAGRYYEKLVTLSSLADSDRPELTEAKAFLARK